MREHPLYLIAAIAFAIGLQYRLSRRLRRTAKAAQETPRAKHRH